MRARGAGKDFAKSARKTNDSEAPRTSRRMRRFDLDDPMPDGGEDRSLGSLFRDLSADASTLIRQEVALAKAELTRGARTLAGDLGRVAAWGTLATVGGLALVAFLVAALGDLLDNYWLAALLVGLLFVAVGALLVTRSLGRLRETQLRPSETVATLRDTRSWAQGEAAELRAALSGRADGDGRGPDRAPPRVSRIVAHARTAPPAGEGRRLPHASPRAEEPAPRAAAPEGSLPRRVWAEVQKNDVTGQAAKVAYYFFMSLPPALMAVFAMSGIFGGPELAGEVSSRMQGALPAEAAGLVNDFVDQVVLDQKPALLSIGLLLALWSASNVFTSMSDTLNVAFDVREGRSWVKRKAVALVVLVAVSVLFLAGSSALLAGPQIAETLGLGRAGSLAWAILQWPLAFGLISTAFWIIYYALPDKDQSGCRGTLFRASMVAAALWLLATFGFRLYVANFGSYGATYGFIGGVIVLLLWMYVTSIVILLGGEIAAEMER